MQVIRTKSKIKQMCEVKKLTSRKSFAKSITRIKSIRFIGFTASFCFILLALLSVFPLSSSQDLAEGTSSPVSSTTSITISTNDTASIDLAPSSSNGTFASSDIGGTNVSFNVTTNNYTGYTLSISASDDLGLLTNTNTGDSLSSIIPASGSSSVSESDFSADTLAAATNYNGKWGYKPSVYNSVTNVNYLPSPTTTASIINKTNLKNGTDATCVNPLNTNCSSHEYTIGIGVRVDYTKPTGTYTNTYTLTAVGNPVAYAITYDATTSDVSNLPSDQVSDGSDGLVTSVTLSPDKTPVRSGYVFRAWCDGTLNTNTTATATICTGTEYQPGDTFNLDQTSSNEVTLYAVWAPYIQDLTASVCSTLASSSDYIVYDKRDNKNYTVRYINGHCWMNSNLRFTGASTDSAGTMTLNNSTSNVSASYTDSNPLVLTYYSLEGTEGTSTSGKCHGEYNTTTGVASGNGYSYLCTEEGVDENDKPTAWYNYAAASAGSITGLSNTTVASYSICPSGWRMPTQTELADISSYSSAYKPTYGGYYVNGEKINLGSGLWWSSTTGSNNAERIRLHYTNESYNITTAYRRTGLYVRCIQINSISDAVSMQQLGSLTGPAKTAIQNSMAEGTSYTLPDVRDSNNYTVAKINGHVWMTSNLLFTGTSLNAATSNVASNYTESSPLTLTYYELAGTQASSSSGRCYGSISSSNSTTVLSGAGFSNPCRHVIDSNVWYNYAAATAGTIGITQSTNILPANYSICPAGWRLSTRSEDTTVVNYVSSFKPTSTGYYMSGTLQTTSTGYWSGIGVGDKSRTFIFYNPNTKKLSADSSWQIRGYHIRCIAQ